MRAISERVRQHKATLEFTLGSSFTVTIFRGVGVLLGLFLITVVVAEDYEWNVTDGWMFQTGSSAGTEGNWKGGMTPFENAVLSGDKTVWITSGTAKYSGNPSVTWGSEENQTQCNLNVLGGVQIFVQGGKIEGQTVWTNICVGSGGKITLGTDAADTTSSISFSGWNSLYLGTSGTGTFVQRGGIFTTPIGIYLGGKGDWQPSATHYKGVYHLYGGTVNATSGNGFIQIGKEGQGVWNQYGGTLNAGSITTGNGQGLLNFFLSPEGFGKIHLENDITGFEGTLYVGVAGFAGLTPTDTSSLLIARTGGISKTASSTLFNVESTNNGLQATLDKSAQVATAMDITGQTIAVPASGWISFTTPPAEKEIQVVLNRDISTQQRADFMAWLANSPNLMVSQGGSSDTIRVAWTSGESFAWDLAAYNAEMGTNLSVIGLGNASRETYFWKANQAGTLFTSGNSAGTDGFWEGGLTPFHGSILSGEKTVYLPATNITFSGADKEGAYDESVSNLSIKENAKLVLDGTTLTGEAHWGNVCLSTGGTLEMRGNANLFINGWNALYVGMYGEGTVLQYGGKVVTPRGLWIGVRGDSFGPDETRMGTYSLYGGEMEALWNTGTVLLGDSDATKSTGNLNLYGGTIKALALEGNANGRLSFFLSDSTPGTLSVNTLTYQGKIHVGLDHGFGFFPSDFSAKLLTVADGLTTIPDNTTASPVFSLSVAENALSVSLREDAWLGEFSLEQGGRMDDKNGYGWITLAETSTDNANLIFQLSGLEDYTPFVDWLVENSSQEVTWLGENRIEFLLRGNLFAWDFTPFAGGDVRMVALEASVPEPATWCLLLLGGILLFRRGNIFRRTFGKETL
ncbi:MAG: hypothetical protein Q4D62_04070 [Planctomycetia bacterium]|nr:hypothetical protein [Planctomycetia bacterium]